MSAWYASMRGEGSSRLALGACCLANRAIFSPVSGTTVECTLDGSIRNGRAPDGEAWLEDDTRRTSMFAILRIVCPRHQ